MKNFLGRVGLFLKKISIIYRLIGIVLAGFVVFGLAIPDLKFNLSTGKVVEMTLDQLMNTPADEIPRYLKIQDAVVPSGSYIEFRKSKNNSLTGIYYPVYASNEVNVDINEIHNVSGTDTITVYADSSGHLSALKNTNSINSKLVIHDSHVKDSDLDSNGKYFSDPNFTIEGQYNGDKLGDDVLGLFSDAGLNVSPDSIVLNRGNTTTETPNAILVIFFGLLIIFIDILSFVPESTLTTWLRK